MSFEKWLLGAMANCEECDFLDEDFTTAQKAGRKHFNITGHEVTIELVYNTVYKR